MNLKSLFPKASLSFIQANEKVLRQIAPDIRAADKAFTPDAPKPRRKAMTQTESGFAMFLEAQRRTGEIHSYKFEGVTLRLADNCRYTPDFLVVVSLSPLKIRLVEVKGRHVWDDSKVKYKVAKDLYPWAEWQLWQKAKGRWSQIA